MATTSAHPEKLVLKWAQWKDRLFIKAHVTDAEDIVATVEDTDSNIKSKTATATATATTATTTTLTITLRSGLNGKLYRASVTTYLPVTNHNLRWNEEGDSVLFTVRKAERRQEFWPRLTKDKELAAEYRCDWDHWCDVDDETMTRLKQKMPTEFDAQRMMREGREEGLPDEIDIDSRQTLTDIFRGSPAEPAEMFLSFFWTIFCTVQAVLWVGVAIRARARMWLDDELRNDPRRAQSNLYALLGNQVFFCVCFGGVADLLRTTLSIAVMLYELARPPSDTPWYRKSKNGIARLFLGVSPSRIPFLVMHAVGRIAVVVVLMSDEQCGRLYVGRRNEDFPSGAVGYMLIFWSIAEITRMAKNILVSWGLAVYGTAFIARALPVILHPASLTALAAAVLSNPTRRDSCLPGSGQGDVHAAGLTISCAVIGSLALWIGSLHKFRLFWRIDRRIFPNLVGWRERSEANSAELANRMDMSTRGLRNRLGLSSKAKAE